MASYTLCVVNGQLSTNSLIIHEKAFRIITFDPYIPNESLSRNHSNGIIYFDY